MRRIPEQVEVERLRVRAERAEAELARTRAALDVVERRAQATHPARVAPELLATAPGQVWSWDITKLRCPDRGVYYNLYVVLDIFSRYVVGWTVAAREDACVRSGARLR